MFLADNLFCLKHSNHRHFFHAITGAKYVGEKKEETREARKGTRKERKEKEKISF